MRSRISDQTASIVCLCSCWRPAAVRAAADAAACSSAAGGPAVCQNYPAPPRPPPPPGPHDPRPLRAGGRSRFFLGFRRAPTSHPRLNHSPTAATRAPSSDRIQKLRSNLSSMRSRGAAPHRGRRVIIDQSARLTARYRFPSGSTDTSVTFLRTSRKQESGRSAERSHLFLQLRLNCGRRRSG